MVMQCEMWHIVKHYTYINKEQPWNITEMMSTQCSVLNQMSMSTLTAERFCVSSNTQVWLVIIRKRMCHLHKNTSEFIKKGLDIEVTWIILERLPFENESEKVNTRSRLRVVSIVNNRYILFIVHVKRARLVNKPTKRSLNILLIVL